MPETGFLYVLNQNAIPPPALAETKLEYILVNNRKIFQITVDQIIHYIVLLV